MPTPYISEVKNYGSPNSQFIEIRVDVGTDVSNLQIVVYVNGGTVEGTVSLGSIDATMNGSDVYLLNFSEGMFDGMTTNAFAIVEDGTTVHQFLAVAGGSTTATEGPAAGMTADYYNRPPVSWSLQSDDGGATYYDQDTPNPGSVPAGAPPCYAPGTLIDTPGGPRAVETLMAGDLVITLDHGPQEIRWLHSGDHPLEEVEGEAKPVLIAAGALGRGLPTQDLIVSPQHRMFVGGGGQLDGWFKTEAFAPAKSLTAVQGIRHMKGKQNITWIHFACDRHEVVTANGCLSESLLLGPMVVNGLTATERRTLTDIFGSAQLPDVALNGPPARECLKVGEVRRHLEKCKKEKRRRIAKDIRKWDRDLAMEQYEAERLREASSMNEPRNEALGAA